MRSLSELLGPRRPAEPAFAGVGGGVAAAAPTVLLRGERARRGALWRHLRFDKPMPRGVGLALASALLLFAAIVGAVRGGQYQAFVQREGGVGDFIARGLGMGVKIITISGQSRLSEAEVLAIAGISPRDSMPLFDVEAARARLEKTPLIGRAGVRKLYPGQIAIDIVERAPAALWQRDGEVRTIGADGTTIDEFRDAHFDDLPFVVGDGANERLPEFLSLLAAAQELRTRIGAGVLVGGRRWNLKMKSGLEVKLPEEDPSGAMATLVSLQRQSRILERDILSIDLRVPGRVFARLSADAAAARAEALSHAKRGVQR